MEFEYKLKEQVVILIKNIQIISVLGGLCMICMK